MFSPRPGSCHQISVVHEYKGTVDKKGERPLLPLPGARSRSYYLWPMIALIRQRPPSGGGRRHSSRARNTRSILRKREIAHRSL